MFHESAALARDGARPSTFGKVPRDPFKFATGDANAGGPSSTRPDRRTRTNWPHRVRPSKSRIFIEEVITSPPTSYLTTFSQESSRPSLLIRLMIPKKVSPNIRDILNQSWRGCKDYILDIKENRKEMKKKGIGRRKFVVRSVRFSDVPSHT